MRLLLDTHAFIWMDDDASGKLSPAAADAIADVGNTLYLSVASVWEMQVKIAAGKLTLSRHLKDALAGQRTDNALRILPIRPRHVFMLDWLPEHHRDPFDRILIAQAARDGLTLVTRDPQIGRHPVPTPW